MARPKSDLAPRILEAARRRFLTEGVDGASLRQIAADAGTTIGMVYYYYATKDELFLAVVENVYEKVLEDLASALSPDVEVEERIERVYRRIAAMSDVEFDVVRIVLREALVSSERLRTIANRGLRGHLPWLLATVDEGRRNGRLDASLPMPVELASIMALGLFPQLVLRLARDAQFPVVSVVPPADQIAGMLARVMKHGLAGPRLERTESEPSSE